MARPFSSLTKVGSEQFTRTLTTNSKLIKSLRFTGKWVDRRFVIAGLEPVDHVSAPIHDLEKLTLTLPVISDPEYYVRECSSFGAVVAAMFRKLRFFEYAIGSDGFKHVAHAYHHVALCGFKGSWAASTNTFLGVCVSCQEVAETKPNHRARMHPLR